MKLKQIWFNAEEALMGTGFIAFIGYLVGLIVCAAIVKFSAGEEDVTCGHIGSLLALMFTVMFVVVINTSTSIQRFNRLICMSQTRKNFILQEISLNVITISGLLVINSVLFLIEDFLLKKFYPGIPLEFDLGLFYHLLIEKVINVPALIVIAAGLSFFISGAFIRFGQVAFWILWALWMSLCLSTDKWIKLLVGDTSVFRKNILELWGMWNGYFCQIIGIVVAVVLSFVAAMLIRKQEVKGM